MSPRVALAAALCLLAGLVGPAAGTPVTSAVTKYFTLQSEKDCDGWVGLFADDFSVTDPLGTAPITNRTALLQGCKGGAAFFAQILIVPTLVTEVPGQQAAAVAFHVASVVNATTGCSLSFDGQDVFQLDESNLITSVVGYYNSSIPQSQVAACQGGGRS